MYQYPDQEAVLFDHILQGPGDTYIALKRVDDVWFVIHRGSVTAMDWLNNIDAIQTYVAQIGYAHKGFLFGMEENWCRIKEIIGDLSFVIAGHSRGAGEATIMTGFAVRSGRHPLRRIVMGEPRSCDDDFAKIISVIPSSSFCNVNNGSHDPVVSVPVSIPEIFDYTRVSPLVKLHAKPSAKNPWLDLGPIALHWAVDYCSNVNAHYEQKIAA